MTRSPQPAPEKEQPRQIALPWLGMSGGFLLEEELPAELELTRIVSAGYLPEVAVVASAVHLVELRMVEGVEGFRPELQVE